MIEELQKKVLGALMLSREAYFEAGSIREEFFPDPKLKSIFKIIEKLVNDGSPIDLMTVGAKFGDKKYLVDLLVINSWDNINSWVALLAENYYRQKLVSIAEGVVSHDRSSDVFDTIDKTLKELFDLATIDIGTKEVLAEELLSKFTEELIANIGVVKKGIPSGLKDIDEAINGWQDSDLIIIGARPGMGKSAFSTSISLNSGVPTGIFSLEMSSKQVLARLCSADSRVELEKIKKNTLTTAEIQSIKDSNVGHIVIDDTPALTVQDLRIRAKKMKAFYGIKLIIVDYLQLMRGTTNYKGNRDNELGEITGGLKQIAKELNVPVIALSQLSRAAEATELKQPKLNHLRESGNIEQDADIICFLWRPEYYKIETDGGFSYPPGFTEFTIQKHRNGDLATVPIIFNGDITRFFDNGSFREELPDSPF